MTWLDTIIKALNNLGGKASLSQIYEEVFSLKKTDTNKTIKETIRDCLHRHCSTSSRYNGKNIFYSAYGVTAKKGIWGLRNYVGKRENDKVNTTSHTDLIEKSKGKSITREVWERDQALADDYKKEKRI